MGDKNYFFFIKYSHLFFRGQVAIERSPFQSLISLLEKVIVVIPFIGFLSEYKHHVKSLQHCFITDTHCRLPQVVLMGGKVRVGIYVGKRELSQSNSH